jgi:hypothetical protein
MCSFPVSLVNKLSIRSTIWIRKLLADWIKRTEDLGLKPEYDRARTKLKKSFRPNKKAALNKGG